MRPAGTRTTIVWKIGTNLPGMQAIGVRKDATVAQRSGGDGQAGIAPVVWMMTSATSGGFSPGPGTT